MQIHRVCTYLDGQHSEYFYLLTENDRALQHALAVIGTCPDIDYFMVDDNFGPEFLDALTKRLFYPQSSTGSANE